MTINNMLRSKRGAAAAILFIIIIIIIIVWVVDLTTRQCRNDPDCGEGYYCGSDFQCHEHRMIEKTIVNNYDFTGGAIVLAIAAIVVAIILRWHKLKPREQMVAEQP